MAIADSKARLFDCVAKPVKRAGQGAICENTLQGEFLLLVESLSPEINLMNWLSTRRNWLEQKLQRHGAVIFRGFFVDGVSNFRQIVNEHSRQTMDYDYGSTPRSAIGEKVYTATEYPADQEISQHNEMSYTTRWPMKLFLFCETPAQSGGATPLCDSRLIYKKLDPSIRRQFEQKKVKYTRTYYEHLKPTWQDIFRTEDINDVYAYCNQYQIDLSWLEEDKIFKTEQIAQGLAYHPKTKDPVWFNQAHLFHKSNLDPRVRTQFEQSLGEALPRNAYYGDGTALEQDVLQTVRELYRENTVSMDWKKHDVAIVDNMLASHGREPFTGARRVLVALADPTI